MAVCTLAQGQMSVNTIGRDNQKICIKAALNGTHIAIILFSNIDGVELYQYNALTFYFYNNILLFL